MNKSFVAVIDGTRARFFTLQYPDFPEYESGPDLIESECLTNTSKELQGKELWANTKTGSNHGNGTKGHNYDDHRQNHLIEFERSFAKEIGGQIEKLTQENQCNHLVLVAEPQILGMVRESIPVNLTKSCQIDELAKDLCKQKPKEIHNYLASKKLLPERKIVSTKIGR